MKKKLIVFVLCMTCLLTACEEYLTHNLGDQLTIEKVFTSRSTTQRFFGGVYGYLPNYYELYDQTMVPCSDEAYFNWTQWTPPYVSMNNGSYNTSTGAYQIWSYLYKAISQATTFIDHVDECTTLTDLERTSMKAEARFLRAYYYFRLFETYGPVFVHGDKEANQMLNPDEIDRHPVDSVISFITTELDRAEKDMLLTMQPVFYGRATKGTALALKSRLTLYAARPLFNGCDLYKGMKNIKGEYLFPQTPDPKKWDLAYDAAKAVMDLGIYDLYKSDEGDNDFEKGARSYMGVIFNTWNKEIIWGRWIDEKNVYLNMLRRSSPPKYLVNGYGGYSPSIKLVDTYPMQSTGKYPTDYVDATGAPVTNAVTGYKAEGFTEGFQHPIDKIGSIKIHNSCLDRDPRFYASILFNGQNWINDYVPITKGPVTFFTGGSSPFGGIDADQVKNGFLFRRFVNPALDIDADRRSTYSWPYFRYAEILFNYAEACNEKTSREGGEAVRVLNLIRRRSGAKDIDVAYPGIADNKELLRTVIRKEKMVEMAFENLRYYDIRTTMTAPQEANSKRYGLNLLAKNYEDSWVRTDKICTPIVFFDRSYLLPISQSQLNEMRNITQNYGW